MNIKDKEFKKEEQISLLSKVKGLSITSFIIVLLAIICFIVGIFTSSYDFNSIISSDATVNPFLKLGADFSGFWKETSNIIFGSLVGASFVLLYIGLFVLPISNIRIASKIEENKVLLNCAIYSSLLSLVLLPLAPLVWLIGSICTIGKSHTMLSELDDGEQENKKANINEEINVVPPIQNSMMDNQTMHPNQPITNGSQFPPYNPFGTPQRTGQVIGQRPVVVRRQVPNQPYPQPGMRPVNLQNQSSIIRQVGPNTVSVQHVQNLDETRRNPQQ